MEIVLDLSNMVLCMYETWSGSKDLLLFDKEQKWAFFLSKER